MILHKYFGRHVADPDFSHWDAGHFVSRCLSCHSAMIRLPGLPWRLRTAG